MIHAVIGIGSNSTRMLLAEVDPHTIAKLSRHREDTRLFSGLENGLLTPAAMLSAADAVGRLIVYARQAGAEKLHIIATCAMREATNSAELCEIIEAMAECPVRILSGEEEARLSFLGGAGTGYCALLDLGGGSLELAVGGGGTPMLSGSAPLGARRLLAEVPDLSGDGFAHALGIASERAGALLSSVLGRGIPPAVFIVGGTATALASMDMELPQLNLEAVEGHILSLAAVENWATTLAPMTTEERAQVPGVPPHRADIIAHGAVALLGAMRGMNIKRVSVSTRTNLDGYLREIAGDAPFDPAPEVRRFYDASAESEWERMDQHWFEFEVNKRYIERYIRPGDRVLDVGGGPGRYSLHLASRGADVTLLDLSPGNVAVAKRKSAEQRHPIGAEVADARDLSAYPDGAYDAVLLMGPLYHLLAEPDRMRAVNESLRCLKPGGVLFAAFISTNAGMIFAGRDLPESVLWEAEDTFYETIIAGTDFAGAAFTQAFFISWQNISPFMAKFPLEPLHLVGSEGVTAPFHRKLMEQPPEVRAKWLALSMALCEREAYHPFSEHFLYIGRKKGA